MRQLMKCAALAAVCGVFAAPVAAQEKLKIGLIVTLSGPAASLGSQVRDGFNLAVKDLGGKMGGRDVEVVVVDDELKPDAAVSKVKGLLERDKVDFVVGPIFSNILQAIHKPVIDTKTFLITRMPARRAMRARIAARSSMSPPTRTIRCMRSSARSRRIAATSAFT